MSATITLPVRLTIGDHTAEVATIELDATEQIGPQIADVLRAMADAYATTTVEGGTRAAAGD